MLRMQHPAPTRKVVGSAVAGAITTIVVYVLNAHILETPLPGEVAVAVATLVAFVVGYVVAPSDRDGYRIVAPDKTGAGA